ncbi:MAG: TetR family transcriptional regulator [Paraperlucidibaca sp.]
MARTPRFDRQLSLDRAMALFWSKGYYACSMKHIEQALDMRPGSIYATFGSKSGLFAEALEVYFNRMGVEFLQLVSASPLLVDGLKHYFRAMVKPASLGEAPQPMACMLIKTLLEINDEDKDLAARANDMLGAIETGLCQALELAKASGELRADTDCPRLARLLQAQIIGLRIYAERSPAAAHLELLAGDMANILDAYSA